MEISNRFQVRIGDNNRDVLIGDGITSIRTGDIRVEEGGTLMLSLGEAQDGAVLSAPPFQAAGDDEILIL